MPTLEDGRRAFEEGNSQQARLIFEALLQDNPRSEDAWLGLAEVLTETEDKRICYENVLKINKKNKDAKEGLRNLEPQADPLIAALQQQTSSFSLEKNTETVITDPDDTIATPEAASRFDDGPPPFMLAAIGLALSVVIFALGSGLVYFLIDSIR